MRDSTPLRIGLVGAGTISHAHLPNLLALGADVVVFSQRGADEIVARYGGTRVDSLDELLERVDFVDVVTPTPTHHDIVRRALAAGKSVISEKPLARTVDEAEDLVRAADDAGLSLRPAHVVRYFPAYAALHDAVARGTLGDLAVLRFFRSGAFPTGAPWFADAATSGGIILDQMIHDLDIARWVAGDVERVSAVATRRGTADAPIEAAHVLLVHATGAISQVSGVWGPAHLPFTTGYSVTGTRGSLTYDSAAERPVRSELRGTAPIAGDLPEIDPVEDPYFLELRDFVTGDPDRIRVSGDDGVEAVRIAEAARESLRSGRPVKLTARSAAR